MSSSDRGRGVSIGFQDEFLCSGSSVLEDDSSRSLILFISCGGFFQQLGCSFTWLCFNEMMRKERTLVLQTLHGFTIDSFSFSIPRY